MEVAGVGEFFTCSKVSSTTSGACFTVLCLSSSRSSFKAVFMVSSISYGGGEIEEKIGLSLREQSKQTRKEHAYLIFIVCP